MKKVHPLIEREHRFGKWYGWRPTGAIPCPRYAAGKRCRADGEGACICERHPHHLLDHAAVWLDRDNRRVYTAEPYGAYGYELGPFIADLEPLGLKLEVRAESGWYPGRTVLLIARKADA